MKDLTGQKFGRLTVLEKTDKRKYTRVIYLCECDCGNTKEVISSNLTQNQTRSCGCLNKERARERMAKINENEEITRKKGGRKDLTGERYGMLIALRPTEKRDCAGSVVWEFKCDCGNYCYKTATNNLLRDAVNCGCLTEEKQRKNGLANAAYITEDIAYETNAKLLKGSKAWKGNASGVRGVTLVKRDQTWRATITFQKKQYHLGCFKNKEDAIKARKHAESMMFEPFLEWYEEQKKMKVGE